MDATSLLNRLIARRDLTREQARDLFDQVMEGALDEPRLAAVLTALATKGEAVSEIVGAAEAMRRRVTPIRLPAGVPAIDTCGTGGDGVPHFNVSSTVAIVAAAAGVVVAKHGNRSNARPSGSAEGLAALGINVDADVPAVERCLAEAGVAFLYAPKLHPAMKAAAPVRRAIGIRTIFNLVGPLTNPAGVRRQLLGVNRAALVETMLAALGELGAERAMVVHGLEGVCDLSVAGPSLVGYWDGETARVERIDCGMAGVERGDAAALRVGSPEESAGVIRGVLEGQRGPARETVVLNAAAALWVAGVSQDWNDGASRARAALDGGAAQATLERWIRASQSV